MALSCPVGWRISAGVIGALLLGCVAGCVHDMDAVDRPPGADSSGADLTVDLAPDKPRPDLIVKDRATQDRPADLAASDKAKTDLDQRQPDGPLPDKSLADLAKADLPGVDTIKPDTVSPDHGSPTKALVDDTFADFSQGELQDSGARLYVSAKGNVQMLDRLDLNQDGYHDAVISNSASSSGDPNTNSYIYWGASLGLSSTNIKEIPTIGAFGNLSADLNDDGYPDLVFSQSRNKTTKALDSYIYWGSQTGFSSNNRAGIPTLGATGVAAADLNADGYLDLVFPSHWDGTNYNQNSLVYWGAKAGYSKSNRTELPTLGAWTVTVADLNGDSYLDLVFPSHYDGSSFNTNSLIYWSDKGSFKQLKKTLLPTSAPLEAAAADLDKDGHLDLIFATYLELGATGQTTNSLIYWGGSGGHSTANRTYVTTRRAHGVSVADLDRDGNLDLVFSNRHDYYSTTNKYDHAINSYIYWGAGTRTFSASKRAEVPTVGSVGNVAADFDGNGDLDLLFFNASDGKLVTSNQTTAYVYWGPAKSYSIAKRTSLPSMQINPSTHTDPGAVSDRRPVQTFTSRIFDAGLAPTYVVLTWNAKVPKNTSLKLQLRSGSSAAVVKSAKWRGPTSTSDLYQTSPAKVSGAHAGDRYLQYRATFTSDLGNTPVLESVTLGYK